PRILVLAQRWWQHRPSPRGTQRVGSDSVLHINLEDIDVRSLDVDFLEVSWKVQSTTDDLFDYTFQVLRSQGPAGPFEAVSPEMEDRFIFIDRNLRTGHDFRTYFYKIRIKNKLSGQTQDFGPADAGPDA